VESQSANQLPLVVIVGPTASGKTALAVQLAKEYEGEIICADSRTIYKGMDIGTAKPTQAEQEVVPHWGIDLVEPDERFTASDFKTYAETKIEEIRARGHVPFLVGGTGLYVDAILFNYQFGSKGNPVLRQKLEGMTVAELQAYCIENNVTLPENDKNKRYLIRAIEQKGVNIRKRTAPVSNSIIVGIATEKAILDERIIHRTEQLFQNGVVEEAIKLGKKYGWESEAFTGNIYKVVKSYLAGDLEEKDMQEKFTTLDRQLAKRQMTWLRRNQSIHWASLREAEQYISRLLAK
jgi:tRNA dimethylallyltransferase